MLIDPEHNNIYVLNIFRHPSSLLHSLNRPYGFIAALVWFQSQKISFYCFGSESNVTWQGLHNTSHHPSDYNCCCKYVLLNFQTLESFIIYLFAYDFTYTPILAYNSTFIKFPVKESHGVRKLKLMSASI